MKWNVCSIMIAGLLIPAVVFSQSSTNEEDVLGAPYVLGEVLIRYVSQANANDMLSIKSELGVQTIEADYSVPNLELVSLPDGQSVADAIEYYQGVPGVLYVSPNYIITVDGGYFPKPKPDNPDEGPSRRFGDPYFYRSWGIDKVRTPLVWDHFTTGSHEIIVGVVDTGIDYRHEDLADNIWVNPGEIPNNGIDDDGNGWVDDVYGWNFWDDSNDPYDDYFHGTHVAGTIGAVAGNGVGTIGVSPKVTLMACKFLGADGSGTTSNAIKAIDYCVINGAKILNNSWGGGRFSQPLSDAIASAERNGVLFLAAAGNADSDNDIYPNYPASYDAANLISVASSDVDDYKSTFSNWGRASVDLAAPGTGIYSTMPGNDYADKSGTSMATPHVAGVAALMWAHRPQLSVYDIKDILLQSAEHIPNMKGMTVTSGRLNAYRALSQTLSSF